MFFPSSHDLAGKGCHAVRQAAQLRDVCGPGIPVTAPGFGDGYDGYEGTIDPAW